MFTQFIAQASQPDWQETITRWQALALAAIAALVVVGSAGVLAFIKLRDLWRGVRTNAIANNELIQINKANNQTGEVTPSVEQAVQTLADGKSVGTVPASLHASE